MTKTSKNRQSFSTKNTFDQNVVDHYKCRPFLSIYRARRTFFSLSIHSLHAQLRVQGPFTLHLRSDGTNCSFRIILRTIGKAMFSNSLLILGLKQYSNLLFSSHFWPLLKWESGSFAKNSLSLQPNRHCKIGLFKAKVPYPVFSNVHCTALWCIFVHLILVWWTNAGSFEIHHNDENEQESISSSFHHQLFCTKVLCRTFLY